MQCLPLGENSVADIYVGQNIDKLELDRGGKLTAAVTGRWQLIRRFNRFVMMNLKSQDISTKHSGDGLDLDFLLAQNPNRLALRRP